jgi:hypothetical protein
MLLAASGLVAAGSLPEAAYAETRTAADLTPEAVGKAIDAAKDGDTVQLPAGTAIWSKRGWHTGHSPKMKAVTIQGAGIDKTVITLDKSRSGNSCFELEGVEGKPFRVTGIAFEGSLYPRDGSWGPLMSVRGTCKNFRIDHCTFKNSDCMLSIQGDTCGLVDHCSFVGQISHGGNVQPVDFSGPGGANYRKPLTLGTAEATYFEDNEVYIAPTAGANGKRSGNNPWIAPNNCARIVVRHNKIVNAELEIYGPGRNGQYGCQQCEVYDNQFSLDDHTSQIIIEIAAGVGMVFNNTVIGTSYSPRVIGLKNHRTFYVMRGSPFGKADGTNPLDGNQIPSGQAGAGYPCMGQPGRATDLDGDGIFEPTPCYAWNNTLNGEKLLMAVSLNKDPNQMAQIKEGREFFNEEPPAGYYTPYVYPHPLQKGWETLMKSAAASTSADSGSSPTKGSTTGSLAYGAAASTERISLAGLWRWQPAEKVPDHVPADGWGYLQVPSPWPGSGGRGGQLSKPNPVADTSERRNVTAAWYEVEFAVPENWTGRRVALTTEFLNSFASVHVDGKQVADMRFPGGEVDLTALCRPGQKQVLSMLVLALPLKAVMMSHNDSDAAKEVRGQVGRRGLCGDVYLVGTPQGARIGQVRVEPSVRKWQITFNTTLEGVDPKATYALRAVIKDGEKMVKEFTSKSFRGSDLSNGRIRVTEDWHPDKLWDLHTPKNQYDVMLCLLDAQGKVLDQALPERFGFREFWIQGRDFYLNGTRIFLSFTRSQPGWDYEGTLETLNRYRSVGINFVAVGGFGCQPGEHVSFGGALRAADDFGTLVALTQPHFSAYDWTNPDADKTNGYAVHAEFYTRQAGNHPSVVFYATSHNGCGYVGDMNPDLMDGLVDRTAQTRGRNVENALRAEAIVKGLDDSRILYHHASGNLSSMHTCNFYANFVPIQEMDDWFEHWATVGVKPLHLNEYGAPYPWDWGMYRGWYQGKREFGSAMVPWEFCLAEWDAQFDGAKAYRIGKPEQVNLRWEAKKFRDGALWHRWDYPTNLNAPIPEREGVYSMYVTHNWRAFRTWGLSVNDPTDYINHAPAALLRNNMPLLAYIGGKPEAFTSKDHNFLPGQRLEKQLIVINNSRLPVTAECRWSLGLPLAATGARTVTIETGQQERVPLGFSLPANLAPGRYNLTANVSFSSGEKQEDTFAIDVLPRSQPVRTGGRIALFDPKGETAAMLKSIGINFEVVGPNTSLGEYDVLIAGKGALTLDSPAPDIARVRDGLKVVVFEQTGDVLEQRFGFRIAEYGLRWVFRRVPDHPLLAGLADEHLWNWRGDSTLLPPRGTYDYTYHSPMSKWCGITVTRRWRCGNRGNVASVLIEKPASGDFLPILDGGYALQYATLMEYREGKGMVLFCQADVTGRTESDPAAETLIRNILRYVANWKPPARRTVVYAGEEAGRSHLGRAGIFASAFDGGKLSADQVLVVGPGGGKELAGSATAVAEFLKAGGNLLALGLGEEEANAFLPVKVQMKRAEHIAAYFEEPGVGSPLAGVSPAEVHNRDPREVPLVTGGARVLGDGVLATAQEGRVVFSQLVPWQFDYSGEKMNIKRTFRRVSCGMARVLGNMGAASETPLLKRFPNPVARGEERWRKGYYLDVPEEWDDPYRFFRW